MLKHLGDIFVIVNPVIALIFMSLRLFGGYFVRTEKISRNILFDLPGWPNIANCINSVFTFYVYISCRNKKKGES